MICNRVMVKNSLMQLSIISLLLILGVFSKSLGAQQLKVSTLPVAGQQSLAISQASQQAAMPITDVSAAAISLAMNANPHIPSSSRSANVITQYAPLLKRQLESRGLTFGSPILIRIFKVPSILEVWVQQNDRYVLFKTYAICRFSGRLGPKLRSGDRQAPEGFYNVPASALNPHSSYFLSFNLGYPNQYDKYHNRTGSLLMVHGECASVGCYAMTNARMSEIYTLMYVAFANGQHSIQVHAYPFALTAKNMQQMKKHPWYGFWLNLKQGYDTFNRTQQPLQVSVSNGSYRINARN